MPDRMNVTPRATHHNFDEEFGTAYKSQPKDEEGPSFELGGETFRCVPMLPGYALTLLGRFVGTDDRGRAQTSSDVDRFMEAAIIEERWIPAGTVDPTEDGDAPAPAPSVGEWEKCDDLERWLALMSDKRRPIPSDALVKVVLWLYQWYTDRPTAQSGR